MYRTVERAVDMGKLCDELVKVVHSCPGIHIISNAEVFRVERGKGNSFKIFFTQQGGHDTVSANKVINGLWANRRLVDEMLNVQTSRIWMNRAKVGVFISAVDRLNTVPTVFA